MARWMAEQGEEFVPVPWRSSIALGPTATNNELKGFALPCRAVDGQYYDEGAGPHTFVDDLRHIFANGGFPQVGKYRRIEILRKMNGMADPQSLLDRLTDGLLPL